MNQTGGSASSKPTSYAIDKKVTTVAPDGTSLTFPIPDGLPGGNYRIKITSNGKSEILQGPPLVVGNVQARITGVRSVAIGSTAVTVTPGSSTLIGVNAPDSTVTMMGTWMAGAMASAQCTTAPPSQTLSLGTAQHAGGIWQLPIPKELLTNLGPIAITISNPGTAPSAGEVLLEVVPPAFTSDPYVIDSKTNQVTVVKGLFAGQAVNIEAIGLLPTTTWSANDPTAVSKDLALSGSLDGSMSGAAAPPPKKSLPLTVQTTATGVSVKLLAGSYEHDEVILRLTNPSQVSGAPDRSVEYRFAITQGSEPIDTRQTEGSNPAQQDAPHATSIAVLEKAITKVLASENDTTEVMDEIKQILENAHWSPAAIQAVLKPLRACRSEEEHEMRKGIRQVLESQPPSMPRHGHAQHGQHPAHKKHS
jgi:hypothetical protein